MDRRKVSAYMIQKLMETVDKQYNFISKKTISKLHSKF